MQAKNAVAIILIALVSAGALATTDFIYETKPAGMTAPVVERHYDSAAVLAHHGDHDALAVHDLTLHAVRHFEVTELQPEGLHVWTDWTPEWELRFIPVLRDGRTEGVYHATNKRRPDIRFTITAGSDGADSREWERAD